MKIALNRDTEKRPVMGHRTRHGAVSMTTIKTAAGHIDPIYVKRCDRDRGGTNVYFGRLPDGRYAVASRWQYEIITRDRARAIKAFHAIN